jgi:hypothetical protein
MEMARTEARQGWVIVAAGVAIAILGFFLS